MLLKALSILLLINEAYSQAQHLKTFTTKIYIGAAITTAHLSDANYSSLAAAEFNQLTPENEMKWDAIESSKGNVNYANADKLVSFAQNHSMKIRGPTLIWHQQLPSWVSSLSKADLNTTMHNHITDTVTHFKGKLYAWDVVNEVFNEDGTLRDSVWHENFFQDYVADAFKTAHAAASKAKLYINDYYIEGKNKKSDGLYNLVKSLKTAGVPIDGVGFQSHFSGGAMPADYESNLKRFADLGVEVAITELDITLNENEAQQAKDYGTTFKACISIPSCVGVTIWGVIDKYSWITSGTPLVFDNSYKPKTAIENAIATAIKG